MSASSTIGYLAPRWLRTLLRLRWGDPQAWRLASGLILFAFVLTHLLNHALGLVSIDSMEIAQAWRRAFWRSWTGTILLYGALGIHVGLVLRKLVYRRTWRMPPGEALQVVLGLIIPVMAAAHVASTRGLSATQLLDDSYSIVLQSLWPDAALMHSLLLLVVWGHAVIGLYFWLSTKPWARRAMPVLFAIAVLIPTLALTGWIESARRAEQIELQNPLTNGELASAQASLIQATRILVWSVFGLAALAFLAVRLRSWLGTGPVITYPGGRRIRSTPGATLLEISRAAGISHTSVCGGRGRCTTCRVLILEGAETLPLPGAAEAAALTRIQAPPGVRLACQIRPVAALSVRPLVPLRSPTTSVQDAYRWGVERRITVMFADLRGFTALAERLYPYDAVFLLNRYCEVMAQAIVRHGGEVDKFLGDGIMALFGVMPGEGTGSRNALLAARAMLRALDRLNEEFSATLSEPLRMGVGIHTGPVVLGRVGSQWPAGLTALGDSVNIASRLETLNKEFGSAVVISDEAMRAAGLPLTGAERREVEIRGRGELLTVHVVRDTAAFAEFDEALEAGDALADSRGSEWRRVPRRSAPI